jgi:hypothetical protein
MGPTPSAAQPRIWALTRPPRGGIDVASELRRLMPRDRWLLELLHEHAVFTTEQVAALGFDHIHTARNRLVLLNQRGILARFRDGVRPGSQQWRWTLDLIGAAWIAARADEPEPKPAVIRRRINRLASWPGLAHRLGTNGFFVDLAAHARHTPSSRLGVWWSERTCRTVTGELVRPDGHGVWTEDGSTCSFWLEYDRSTEKAHQVVTKLDGYAALHRATGLNHTVLFWLATPGREASLRARLAKHPVVASGTLLVATAGGGDIQHPAGPVWAPLGTTSRARLAHLSTPPDA